MARKRKYTSIEEMPVSVFHEVAATGNYSLIGNGCTESDWGHIFDSFLMRFGYLEDYAKIPKLKLEAVRLYSLAYSGKGKHNLTLAEMKEKEMKENYEMDEAKEMDEATEMDEDADMDEAKEMDEMDLDELLRELDAMDEEDSSMEEGKAAYEYEKGKKAGEKEAMNEEVSFAVPLICSVLDAPEVIVGLDKLLLEFLNTRGFKMPMPYSEIKAPNTNFMLVNLKYFRNHQLVQDFLQEVDNSHGIYSNRPS